MKLVFVILILSAVNILQTGRINDLEDKCEKLEKLIKEERTIKVEN